jgi:hypothetical protein
MGDERQLRDAAENLLKTALEFNTLAANLLAACSWRLKPEQWRRRSDRIRHVAAEVVELTNRIRREAEVVESYVFADDAERDHLDHCEVGRVIRACPRNRSMSLVSGERGGCDREG